MTRLVGDLGNDEEWPNTIEEEDQDDRGRGGDQAEPGYTKGMDDDEDKQRRAQPRPDRGNEPAPGAFLRRELQTTAAAAQPWS